MKQCSASYWHFISGWWWWSCASHTADIFRAVYFIVSVKCESPSSFQQEEDPVRGCETFAKVYFQLYPAPGNKTFSPDRSVLGARPSAQCRQAAVTLGSSRSFQARGMLSRASITGVNRMQTKYFYDLFICLRPIVAAKELKMNSCLSVCQSGLVFTTKTAVCCIQKRLCKTLPLLFHNIHYIYTLF